MVIDVIAIIFGLLLILLGGSLLKLVHYAIKKKMKEKDITSLIVFASLELILTLTSTGGIVFAITLILSGLFLVLVFTIDLIRSLLS
jgi:hypothetical protein